MIDVYVTGGGVAALAAALDLVEVGLSVRVAVSDAGKELPDGPVRDPEGTVTTLLERLASPLTGDTRTGSANGDGEKAEGRSVGPTAIPPEAVALPAARGGWQVQPVPAVLGVPAVPLSAESLAILGKGGAFRAYLDRVKPLLTIGKTREFGALVRSRVGRTALERLAEPLTRERFGVGAEDVDVAVAAPGLNEVLSRTGSLTGAVLAYAERHVARETGVIPVSGWGSAREVLLERLTLYGAQLTEAHPVSVRLGSDHHVVEESGGASVEARAVILDRGREAGLPGAVVLHEDLGDSELPDLESTRVRAIACAGVEPSASAPGGSPTLSTVVLSSGKRWSVRVSGDTERGRRAELLGPASSADAAGPLPEPEDLAAALVVAGLSPLPDVGWKTRLVAAPHARVEQREAGRAVVETFAGLFDGRALPVGSSLHGDDLSAALEHAHEQTVHLRRRLAGIAG